MRAALRDLSARWQRFWPDSDAQAMAADAERRMVAAVDAWRLPPPVPLRGGVGALTCAAGEHVVKVLPRGHPEDALTRGEGEALLHWKGSGAAVVLLDRRDDGMTLLLPRLHPASKLDDLDYDEQLVVAGELVARLHAAGEAPASVPSIEDYVEPYRGVHDPELTELLAGAGESVAVHADLHGGNVLRDGDSWVAIDPKGVRGDRHLDIWLLLCPQAPDLPDDGAEAELRRRINAYCNAARLDLTRATAWVRVVARAESVLMHDSAFEWWPRRLRQIAELLS